jgi:DNA-binding NtrC family response regulator
MENKMKVLVIDDEVNFTEEMHEFLTKSGYESFTANTAAAGLTLLLEQEIDLLILDIRLPGSNGLEILKDVKAEYPKLEVIIVSGHGDMDSVIKAMRAGALDFLRKPFRQVDIQLAIERTQKFLLMNQKLKQLEEKNSLISKSLEEKIERHFIGESPGIQEVLDLAMTAANFPDTNVLITGESGTGKEIIARIIHYSSDRKDSPFCTVSCSAIADSLLDSEFFGHKAGAFPGANTDKKGFFEFCDKGTLFLDEISDMPFNLQSKMLRAIEEQKITRVGDTEPIDVNFRIIASTNANIDQLVKDNRIRLDLIHRINTLRIHIPPLRERPTDIEPLVNYFAESFTIKLNRPAPKIPKKILDLLKNYDFPGNVRELKNIVERAIILAKDDMLDEHDFRLQPRAVAPVSRNGEQLYLQEGEIRLVRLALKNNQYNQKRAAESLGITRDSLIRRMKKYNIKIRKEG